MKRKNSGIYRNGYQRELTSQGPLHEKNTVINPLPCVGSYVTVKEGRIHDRRLGDERAIFEYEDSPVYKDVWNKPRIYLVERYSLGIENPLDKLNYVVLSYEIRGTRFETIIRTSLIATGNMKLIEVPQNTANKNAVGEQ